MPPIPPPPFRFEFKYIITVKNFVFIHANWKLFYRHPLINCLHFHCFGRLSFTHDPVSTRRRFDIVTTLFGRQQRRYNVETTSSAYWGRTSWTTKRYSMYEVYNDIWVRILGLGFIYLLKNIIIQLSYDINFYKNWTFTTIILHHGFLSDRRG